ncbi:MAG: hypothetical protein QOD69_959 [Solirubrobacteraceae bacterium]|jgi:hypothetical protein|nr:hypothetical protein [Solirubrobacteraceae bacterium]
MSLARRLAEHFVVPAGAAAPAPVPIEDFVTPGEAPDQACASPAARTPTGVAVLTAAPDAPALGAALGLALARLQRAPAAVVCVWSSAPVAWSAWRAPALPAARRLSAGLAARGHDARPAGRLVVVRLAGAGDEAATQARRAIVAAGAAPAVLALGGPRSPAFDALLADQDLVVVATRSGTDPVLTQLAVAGLAGARRACACEVPAAPPARSLAAAGVVLLPSARRALAGAVAELSA